MYTTRSKQTGFSIVGLVVLLAIIVVLGAMAWLVYLHDRSTIATTTGSTYLTNQQPATPTAESTPTTSQPSSPKPVPDVGPHTGVYATWKTYCDFEYHYCFKYPHNWAISSTDSGVIGGLGGAALLNPTKTVAVNYINSYTKDEAIVRFMPVSVDKLTAANQALTIVGGYIPSSGDNGLAGNNVPEYQVVDSAVLDTYPLTIGTAGRFPNTPRFTDQGTGRFVYDGAFTVMPAVTMASLAQSQVWFTSSDAKTGLLILESLSYQTKL